MATMANKRPQNGPTFSKAPPKKRTREAVSPERRAADLDEKMRDAADVKLMRKEPRSWLKKHGLP
jgi:hypothetical protein